MRPLIALIKAQGVMSLLHILKNIYTKFQPYDKKNALYGYAAVRNGCPGPGNNTMQP